MLNNESSAILNDLNKATVGLIEPITISGKSFGIKLLSVYEFLKCDLACRNLVDKLTSQGFDRELCMQTGERACIISLCLYNKNNERVFRDGLSALMGLTPEELNSVYIRYLKLTNIRNKFHKNSLKKIENIKKTLLKSIR